MLQNDLIFAQCFKLFSPPSSLFHNPVALPPHPSGVDIFLHPGLSPSLAFTFLVFFFFPRPPLPLPPPFSFSPVIPCAPLSWTPPAAGTITGQLESIYLPETQTAGSDPLGNRNRYKTNRCVLKRTQPFERLSGFSVFSEEFPQHDFPPSRVWRKKMWIYDTFAWMSSTFHTCKNKKKNKWEFSKRKLLCNMKMSRRL